MTPRFSRSLLVASVAFFGAAFALAQNARQLPAGLLLLHAHPRYLPPRHADKLPFKAMLMVFPGLTY